MTVHPARARSRHVTTAVVLVAALLCGGCSLYSRQVTLEPYAPSDGLQTSVGDVLVRNVLVVSEGGGEPGVVSATLANRGADEATVVVEVAGTREELQVPAEGTLLLGVPSAEQDGTDEDAGDETPGQAQTVTVLVAAVEPATGDVLDVSFADAESGATVLQAPVVPPTGPYAALVPPSQEPSRSPSPSADEPSASPVEPSAAAEPTASPGPSDG